MGLFFCRQSQNILKNILKISLRSEKRFEQYVSRGIFILHLVVEGSSAPVALNFDRGSLSLLKSFSFTPSPSVPVPIRFFTNRVKFYLFSIGTVILLAKDVPVAG